MDPSPMPNIATLLKNEIARVARKEVRAETQSLKKAINTHRGEIAALKRNVRALEQKVRQLGKSRPGNLQARPIFLRRSRAINPLWR